MRGDFSRFTFDSKKHYCSVRLQQGRVQLDSDWNEAQDIRLHYERTIASDAIGPAGGPRQRAGFALRLNEKKDDLIISPGRYYLDGILCENDEEIHYSQQLSHPGKLTDLPQGRYAAYLDVWESAVTAVEDPDIREVALDGPDTAARYKVMWQLIIEPFPESSGSSLSSRGPTQSRMAAKIEQRRASGDDGDDDVGPCSTYINESYRFLGNNLYRVEIHEGGRQSNATFKWSRDNAAIIRAVESIDKKVITVLDPARNCAQLFHPGQYVEVTNEQLEFKGVSGEFACIEAIEGPRITVNREISVELLKYNAKVLLWDGKPMPVSKQEGWVSIRVKDAKTVLLPGKDSGKHVPIAEFAPQMVVEISSDYLAEQGKSLYARVESVTASADGKSLNLIEINSDLEGYLGGETQAFGYAQEGLIAGSSDLAGPNFAEGSNPRIRRWDSGNDWVDLEMNIKLSFPREDQYRKGDYWLIPSREIKGDIIWPRDPEGQPEFLPRQGVVHHLARIAEIEHGEDGWIIFDRRNLFPELVGELSLDYAGGDGQQGRRGEMLPGPFLAAVSFSGMAAAGREVFFRIEKGEGRLTTSPPSMPPSGSQGRGEGSGEVVALTDERGIAACYCRMDSPEIVVATDLAVPQARAGEVSSSTAIPGAPPLRFRACWPSAEGVGYSLPPVHHQPGKSITVKDALDSLYLAPRGSQCAVSVGKGGTYAGLDEAIGGMIGQGKREISLCLLPGIHTLERSLIVKSENDERPAGEDSLGGVWSGELVQIIEVPVGSSLSIKGSAGSKIALEGGKRIIMEGLLSLRLEDLEIEGEGREEALLCLRSIDRLALTGCIIRAEGAATAGRQVGEGIAMSIKNGEGSLMLHDNQIEGVLCLYEGPAVEEFDLDAEQAGNLKRRAGLILGKVRRGTLNMSGNRIGRIASGDRMASLIKSQLAEKQGKPVDDESDPAVSGARLEDIFQVMILTGNVIGGGPNHLFAGNLIVSGNYFEEQRGEMLGRAQPQKSWAIAGKSAFTGNISEGTEFSCVAEPFEQAANLMKFTKL